MGAIPCRQELPCSDGPSWTVTLNTPAARRRQKEQPTTPQGYVEACPTANQEVTLRVVSVDTASSSAAKMRVMT